MRKIRLIFITFIILAIFANSYTFSQASIGFMAGPNFSNLIGKGKLEGSKNRIGISGGIIVDIPIGYLTFLEFGGKFSQQGVISESIYFLYGKKIESKIVNSVDYLVVPLNWKQSFGSIYTKIGPYAALALRAESKWSMKTEFSTDSISEESGVYQSFVNDLRQFDVGITFGLGFESEIGSNLNFLIDFSYSLGLFSIDNPTGEQADDLKNQVINVSIGVIIPNKPRSKTYRRRR